MKKVLRPVLAMATAAALVPALAQERYLEEVFTNDQILVSPNIPYATNIDFLTSNFSVDPPVINTIELMMDIYEPDQAFDTETARPLVIYAHTGDFLPPVINGSPVGIRTDSCAVEMCMRMARHGYVAASVSYRNGWRPDGATLELRRGTLLNAVFRGLHDLKQSVRFLRENAATTNDVAIDPNKVILIGEGTGGYMAQAYISLDQGAEMFIEKFLPDPFEPTVSYIDTNVVGNIEGFGGALNMYTDNGFPSEVQFAVNLGGALADSSWADGGEAPLVSFHTVFDPFAPFGNGIVIVPTTQEQVVPVSGSNISQQIWNDLGNNASFASLPSGDPYTARARSLYGTTIQGVTISPSPEGLFPFIRPRHTAPLQDEASPWQWWDPNSAAAMATPPGAPAGVTTHQLSMASNPDMSGAKGRTYIDTIMGYMNPRIVCALNLGPCSLVGLDENSAIARGVEVFPNPASDRVTFTSTEAPILSYEIFDVNGRLVRTARVNNTTAVMERQGLKPGAYNVQLRFEDGAVARKLMLD
ncbi:MAG: T9SS type A sorting domain-containing protein [Flavobacteriales bacterium]|nr:T9SS type A sorting domain-containing protein [Flavobacteriales bacterium]